MPDEKKPEEEESKAKAEKAPKAEPEPEPEPEPDPAGEAEPKAREGEGEGEGESVGEGEGEAGESEEDDEDEADEAGIDAIAKRADALGGHDELERIARDEEAKLAARRAKQRTGRKKKGLEAAASKRLAKIGTKARPKRAIPEVVEAADPLIERTQALADWAKKNRNVVQGAIVAAVVAAIGGGVWLYHDYKRQAEASSVLAQAVADERGRIGDPDKDDDDNGIKDTTPIFKTSDERRDAALAKYREVETKFAGTGAAWLARLGEGSLLLDKRDSDGAIAAFTDVLGSSLAQADPEVRGRATENLGYAYELRAELKPDQKKDALDKALEQYKQLESNDVFGFAEMAPYDEARVYELQGDRAKALETLRKLREDLMKNPDSRLFSDLRELTDDRMREIDPSSVPPKRAGIGAGGDIDPEMLEKLPPELRQRVLANLRKGVHP